MFKKNEKFKKYCNTICLIAFALIFCFLVAGCNEQANQSVEVDGILISKKNLYMAEGQTAVISAQVFPFNASNQNYTFESSNPDVVNVDNGFVVAKKAGDAIIYVVSEEGGYEDTCNVLVTTVKNNLELNDFNNLNMPGETVETTNYSNNNLKNQSSKTTLTSQKNATQNNESTRRKKQTKIYNLPKNDKKITKNDKKITNNSENSSNILDFSKDIVKQVNAEINEDIETGKMVFEDLKTELKNSIENIASQRETLSSVLNDSQTSIFTAFYDLKNNILDSMQNIQSEMLNEIENIEDKVESGEYTVETKDINGVSFVVIKNAD